MMNQQARALQMKIASHDEAFSSSSAGGGTRHDTARQTFDHDIQFINVLDMLHDRFTLPFQHYHYCILISRFGSHYPTGRTTGQVAQ
jgi:hypothetical protein